MSDIGTITIKCDSCDQVREAMRQLNRNIERLVTVLSTLKLANDKATKQPSPNELNGHREFITVKEFAKRVHRDRRTVHRWLRIGDMPPGTVFAVHGHREIDWIAWQKSIENGVTPK